MAAPASKFRVTRGLSKDSNQSLAGGLIHVSILART